ncbi:MAG: DUF1456 family protein [Lactobacillaceae bacterium]|jgi:uncharacterized protein YehS (DUF1456 family)|nr:DUF1456 family protein [Lactobacillaceae bacterium]
MNNHERIGQIRFALDINDATMVSIFEAGGVTVTVPQVIDFLAKHADGQETLNNHDFESWLNGLITMQRDGKLDANGVRIPEQYNIVNDRDVNNVTLKKLKTALNIPSEELLAAINEVRSTPIKKTEFAAWLRSPGGKYQVMKDPLQRDFLKALVWLYRGIK